jgi:outer membrane biosynthesis protein TonB
MAAAKKIIVLKNRNGNVVRTLNGLSDQRAHLVLRKDTGRVEVHADLVTLQDIPYELIGAYKADEIAKTPIAIKNLGTIEAVEKVENPSVGLNFHPDNQEEFKAIIKWTSGIHVALVLLLIITSAIFNHFTKKEEVVVEVFSQELLKKPEIPTPTVKMSEKKPVAKRVTKIKNQKTTKQAQTVTKQRKVPTKSTVNQSRVASNKPAAQPQKPKELGQMGALGALGGASGSKRSGLDIGRAGAKGVAGLGTGTTSGVDRAIHSVGMIAVSGGGGEGAGSGARGGGGYSTRGMGSGQGEYGKHSLGGASSGFINPLSAESEIEGGLDRAAVDAVVRRNQGQIAYCYEKSLQVKPSIAGRVNLHWTIAADGRVSSIGVVSNSLPDQNVVNCMMSKVKSWQFPKPVGGVNVKVTQYPFDLRKNM